MGYYSTTLQKGSQGDEVKKWQEFLNTQGYGLSVDGDFGTKTYDATVAYQKAMGLVQDGIVGEKTWGAAGFKLSPSSQDFKYDDFKYGDFKYDDFKYGDFKYDDFKYDDYNESNAVKDAGAALDALDANKPGKYQSQWQAGIDALMDKILNREEFSYDLNSDALYNQYKDQYMTQGKLAMEDAMGQAAAMTGGYGNSYAATVGNQAYQAYLEKLNNIVPELYQMALDRYTREGENLYNQYGMLSDRENLDYGRHRDSVADYLNERNYLAGRYDSERDYDYSKYVNERGFDYDKYSADRALDYNIYSADRDFEYNKYSADRALDYDKYSSDRSLAYDEYSTDKNLSYQEYRDAIADEQREKEFAENKRRYEESKVTSSGESGAGGIDESGAGGINDTTNNTPNNTPKTKDEVFKGNFDKMKLLLFEANLEPAHSHDQIDRALYGPYSVYVAVQIAESGFNDEQKMYLITKYGITEADIKLAREKGYDI